MGSWNSPGNAASRQLNILLVGPRRTGKSSTGNTLLGQGQVFDTRGGGASAAARGITAGRHLAAVDAQGWGLSEEFVSRDEKIELLRALSLCGTEGPHVVLLVIPLLDFTEAERRAVERRMEVFTSGVWRHTMVLFTFGDLLKKRGHSIEEHIQSGGPALHWLMERCRYRYHVLDNKAALEQEQVRQLLSKVEDMLQENGGWHFSLHMYQRLQEDLSHSEQQLRARFKEETGVGNAQRKQNTAETKLKVELEQLETEEQDRSLRTEPKNKKERVERKIKREESKNKDVRVELDEDRWDTCSGSRGMRKQERREIMKESTDVHTGKMDPCRPNEGQRLAINPIRRLS
ncbi:GTPase IMAP family member 9-like [Leuresthes tenuis]|uniref:GTPase IMAP family member 9-like n=1 Tax=Leuresthes tenuis TaxID=355514 RepID=UPI003B513EF5